MPTITLIRHGQASFGAANYDQLTDLGYAQSRHLGQVLCEREEPVNAVFMGAMLRHRQTAESCLEAAGLTQLPLQVLPGFNEFNHEQVIERYEPRYRDRDWLTAQMAAHERPGEVFAQFFNAAVRRWIDGEHDSEYDESWRQFQSRVRAALDQALEALGPRGHALVFTSGGCISNVAQSLLELGDMATFRLNLSLANAGFSRVTQGVQRRSLVSLNEHSHFSGRYRHLLSYR